MTTSKQHPRGLDIQPGSLACVQAAIDDIRAGKMVILVDDEDRENEGDLVMAAELVTPEAINFMAKWGRGLICLTLTEEQVERLGLPMMRSPGSDGPPLGTAFTVSIEARRGVSTGISAADRSLTSRVAADPASGPDDIVTPGHVFPLKARPGGVLVRAGQTEGSVDLARLAGLIPAGVICEIMNDDGTMARMPDLETFAAQHGLRILTIADLISYRLQTESLVRRVAEEQLRVDLTQSAWQLIVYEAAHERRQVLALVKGNVESGEPVACRMHRGSTIADVFSSPEQEGKRNLRRAMELIDEEGCGVVVYLPTGDDLASELRSRNPRKQLDETGSDRAAAEALREYGLGAQVLRELGVHRIRLITNNPRKIVGIQGYGLEVVGRIPIDRPEG